MNLRIMSFNLRYNNPDDGRYAWPDRINAVTALLTHHAPDVLCTQEGLHEMLETVSGAFPHYTRFGQGRMADGSDEHVAVFVNKNVLKVVNHGQFWLSPDPDVPGSRAWDTLFPRICTWCVVEGVHDAARLAVFNAHLDNRQERARVEGGRLLREMMPQVAVKEGVEPGAVVLCGDFNAYPDTPEVQSFCKPGEGEGKALVLSGCDDVDLGTYHGFRGVPSPAPIDYILNGEGVTVARREVDQQQYENTWPSDHFPVIADITVSR